MICPTRSSLGWSLTWSFISSTHFKPSKNWADMSFTSTHRNLAKIFSKRYLFLFVNHDCIHKDAVSLELSGAWSFFYCQYFACSFCWYNYILIRVGFGICSWINIVHFSSVTDLVPLCRKNLFQLSGWMEKRLKSSPGWYD